MEKQLKRSKLFLLGEEFRKYVPHNPREAAKNAVLSRIISQSWYAVYGMKEIRIDTDDYSACIDKGKITITGFYGVEMNEVFETEELLGEIVMGLIQMQSKP